MENQKTKTYYVIIEILGEGEKYIEYYFYVYKYNNAKELPSKEELRLRAKTMIYNTVRKIYPSDMIVLVLDCVNAKEVEECKNELIKFINSSKQ